ncbi:MAG: two-component system NtrC family sensor kinase, partial [Pirellulaceae bacterium]
MASLFVIQGRDQGKRFELAESACTVGRDDDSSIQLHDTEVSRQHAEFRPLEDGCEVVDLNSSNGTFINSRRIKQQSLKTGDRIQMGRTMMIFTNTTSPSVIDLSGAVGIVGEAIESRIVSSLSQVGSGVFGIEGEAESPWLARAKSNLQVMYRTALAVSHTLDIDQLLHRIMELIFEWVETDRGCIM